MQIHFLAPNAPQPWDWRDPPGGSETAVVQMSRRWAARGHDVTVYTNTLPDTRPHGLVSWLSLDQVDTAAPGLWIISRWPQSLDRFRAGNPDQVRWLWCDDLDYRDRLTPERAAKLDRVLALSPCHRDHMLDYYPWLEPVKITVTRAGIQSDLIRGLPARDRDPFRLVWPSCPARGLDVFLGIFARAREFEPRLNLHVTYGWQNLDRVAELDPTNGCAELKRRTLAQPQKNVVWHGRLSQREMWEVCLGANIWCYPTEFEEAGCVTAMEQQALGCIPIFPPIWALRESVQHGVRVRGEPYSDALCRTRYCRAILDLVANPELCEQVRAEMVPWALYHFDWNQVIDDHEAYLSGSRRAAGPPRERVA